MPPYTSPPYPTPYAWVPPYQPVQRQHKTLTNPMNARPVRYYNTLQQAPSVIVKQPSTRGFSERLPMPTRVDINNLATHPPTGDLPNVPEPPQPNDPALGYRPPYLPPGSVEGKADTWNPQSNPLLRYYMPPPDIPAPKDHAPTTLPINQIERPPVVDDQLPYYNNDPRLSSYIGSNEQIAPYPTYQVST
jgi:hypothetical protein